MINLDYFVNRALASLCEGKDFMGGRWRCINFIEDVLPGGIVFRGLE
jgi:hypothetical protein